VASRRWHIMPILISNPDKFKQYIYAQAKSQGFDLVGITTPEAIEPAAKLLEAAIIAGHHGTMAWMEETLARRTNPRSLMPDLHSIIMLAVNYGPDEDPLLVQQYKNCGAISVYARHRDYHDLIKGRLKQLASQLKARACQMMGQMGADEMDIKVFVDTAPVMEKPLAAAAGLGWQGKHTNLVNRQLGSWLFLGSIFTNIVLDKNVPENFPKSGNRFLDKKCGKKQKIETQISDSIESHSALERRAAPSHSVVQVSAKIRSSCGSCSACLASCPTQAFPAPYQLDARRCISYLTIELKTHIPLEFRRAIGNRIYGCDDCLAVCPWNKFAKVTNEIKLIARPDLKAPPLRDLLRLDEAAFRLLFSGSPIKRIGWQRFIRNVLIACGNSGDHSLIGDVRGFLDAPESLVRAMAIWALKQLMAADAFSSLRWQYEFQESDGQVKSEWQNE